MAVTNTGVNVSIYANADLAWLDNRFCALALANKKYENFQDQPAQLGQAMTFRLAPRQITVPGLKTTDETSVMRFQTLRATQAANTSNAYTAQELTYTFEEYVENFDMAGAEELGTEIESDLLKNITTSVVGNDPDNTNGQYGVRQIDSGPFRFFGNGRTSVSTFGRLAEAVSQFKQFGWARAQLSGILPENIQTAIVNTGANQFTPARNNQMVKDWEVGKFSGCNWNISNLLPIHHAGVIGNEDNGADILTVVSTNDPTGQNVTEITCTSNGALSGATVADAAKASDMFQFVDNVSGFENMHTLTWVGHKETMLPLQGLIKEDANLVSGTITLKIRTSNDVGFSWATGQNQNLNQPIFAGMKLFIIPSHQAGVIMSGNPLYLAMPEMPSQEPWPTANAFDPKSGMRIRHYYGATGVGSNNRRYVRDQMWGSTLIPEQSMRIVIPLS